MLKWLDVPPFIYLFSLRELEMQRKKHNLLSDRLKPLFNKQTSFHLLYPSTHILFQLNLN